MKLQDDLFTAVPSDRWNNTQLWLRAQGKTGGFVREIFGEESESRWPLGNPGRHGFCKWFHQRLGRVIIVPARETVRIPTEPNKEFT